MGWETTSCRSCQGFVQIWKCSAEKLKLHELSPHFLLREDLIHIKTYL